MVYPEEVFSDNYLKVLGSIRNCFWEDIKFEKLVLETKCMALTNNLTMEYIESGILGASFQFFPKYQSVEVDNWRIDPLVAFHTALTIPAGMVIQSTKHSRNKHKASADVGKRLVCLDTLYHKAVVENMAFNSMHTCDAGSRRALCYFMWQIDTYSSILVPDPDNFRFRSLEQNGLLGIGLDVDDGDALLKPFEENALNTLMKLAVTNSHIMIPMYIPNVRLLINPGTSDEKVFIGLEPFFQVFGLCVCRNILDIIRGRVENASTDDVFEIDPAVMFRKLCAESTWSEMMRWVRADFHDAHYVIFMAILTIDKTLAKHFTEVAVGFRRLLMSIITLDFPKIIENTETLSTLFAINKVDEWIPLYVDYIFGTITIAQQIKRREAYADLVSKFGTGAEAATEAGTGSSTDIKDMYQKMFTVRKQDFLQRSTSIISIITQVHSFVQEITNRVSLKKVKSEREDLVLQHFRGINASIEVNICQLTEKMRILREEILMVLSELEPIITQEKPKQTTTTKRKRAKKNKKKHKKQQRQQQERQEQQEQDSVRYVPSGPIQSFNLPWLAKSVWNECLK